ARKLQILRSVGELGHGPQEGRYAMTWSPRRSFAASLGLPTVLGLSLLAYSAPIASAQKASDDAATQVTFTKDIAPILQRSCQRCHRPDSVAPMPLLTYAEVRPYARAIKQRTALRDAPWGRGAMPPWFLERNIGIQRVKNDPSLSDQEIAT